MSPTLRSSVGSSDDDIDDELRLRTVRTAASVLAESIRHEEKQRRRRKGFFKRKEIVNDGGRRRVYVNQPLPVSEMDADGEPLARYVRNKIRTTKYTVITFIPKNLFEQFRRVANLLFLALAILQLFPVFGAASGAISVLPLAFILAVTAVKDGVEDYRRATLDEEVNTSAATKLAGSWRNVNVPRDPRNWFEKLLGLNKPGKVTKGVRRLREKEGKEAGIDLRDMFNRAQSEEASSSTHSYPPSMIKHAGAASIASTSTLAASSHTLGVMSPNLQTTGTALWERTLWKKLLVGDLVFLTSDTQIPADILVLSTSSPDGLCYVETKNLDGETNLKPRRAISETSNIRSEEDIERARFVVDAEGPHQDLYSFHGVLHYSSATLGGAKSQVPLSINNLLLRGCTVRNTSWVIGLVLYTGADTKILRNSGGTPSKRSKIEKETNFSVIVNFVILTIMCLLSAIINGFWQTQTAVSAEFFEWNFGSEPTTNVVANALVTMVSCLILFQNIVPISLYISIEIVKTIQAYFISQDIDLYYAPYDTSCVPKTWNISDDLGQIEYIFSDKTGTLTQNVMEFLRCSIGGVVYGEGVAEAQRGSLLRQSSGSSSPGTTSPPTSAIPHDGDVEAPPKPNELLLLSKEELIEKLGILKDQMLLTLDKGFKNPYSQPSKLTLISPKLAEDLTSSPRSEQRGRIVEFFKALALCHTVLAEALPEMGGALEYKAESPDEAALVAAARDVGVVFVSKVKETLTLSVLGNKETWTLLKLVEFDSTRKRMTVVVRNPQGRIQVFTKGADTVIYARLKNPEGEYECFAKRDMERFANEGLRTLAIATREIEEGEFVRFEKMLDEAQAMPISAPSQQTPPGQSQRDLAIDRATSMIESELSILGATALEDKLQEGVPEAIETLHRAGIKLWILTGDKLQTAIEIGYSCNLLKPEMDVMILSAENEGVARAQIEAGLNKIASVLGPASHLTAERGFVKKEGAGGGFAVVIDGDTLRYALDPALGMKEMFLSLGTMCETVVCCRVSPAQKAETVKLVKEGRNAMTLSIGDGANDVAMIQEANIGCGLFGLEGSQAAMSADYAFGQFRFLTKLLLVHGRWSYQRVADMHSNFFYKNMIWTFAMFWYLIFNNFDATYLYQYTFILLYNLVFTSLPVIVLGAFDQDLNAKAALAFPQLYVRGIRGLEYTRTKFWLYMFDGLYQSAIVFFIPYLVWTLGLAVSWNGKGIDSTADFGTTVAVAAILAANSYVGISTHYWTIITWVVVFGSTIVMLLWIVVYSFFFSSDFIDEVIVLFGELTFWTTVVFTAAVALAPRYLVKFTSTAYFPLDKDIVREMWVLGDLKDQLGIQHRRDKKKNRRLENGSGAEEAPMFQPSNHLRSTSQVSLQYELAPTSSPGMGGPAIRQTYLDTPPPSNAADSMHNEPSQYVYTSSHLSHEMHLSPPPPPDGRPSPNPSYYSVSELPVPSPLPSPKYMLPSGEITSTPPSRRSSVATRTSMRQTGLHPPVPLHAPTPSHMAGRHPIANNSYEMRVRSPPSSYRREPSVERAENSPTGSRHAYDRSASAASWATANDEFYSAEDGYESTHLEPPDRRASQISWDGGRAL